jgi:hypothetical protein
MVGKIMNDELGNMWKEAVVNNSEYFTILDVAWRN